MIISMLRAQDIVAQVLHVVGQDAKGTWRLGVTNDCERIFEEYTNKETSKKCFQATNNQEARSAVAQLLKRGFNGINISMSLPEFRQVFLYKMDQGRNSRIDLQDPYRLRTVESPIVSHDAIPSRTRVAPSVAGNDQPFAGVQPNEMDAIKPLKPRKSSAGAWVSLIIFFSVILGASFFGLYNNSLYEYETGNLDIVLAQLELCDEQRRDNKIPDSGNVRYTSQYCSYLQENEEIISLLVYRSDQIPLLLQSVLADICVGDSFSENVEEKKYIAGSNFFILSREGHFDNSQGNILIEEIYTHLTGLGLQGEMLDWCQGGYSQGLQAQASAHWQQGVIETPALNEILMSNFQCEEEEVVQEQSDHLKLVSQQQCYYRPIPTQTILFQVYRSEDQAALLEREVSWRRCQEDVIAGEPGRHNYILGDKFLLRIHFFSDREDEIDRDNDDEAFYIALNDLTEGFHSHLIELGLEAELFDWCQQKDI